MKRRRHRRSKSHHVNRRRRHLRRNAASRTSAAVLAVIGIGAAAAVFLLARKSSARGSSPALPQPAVGPSVQPATAADNTAQRTEQAAKRVEDAFNAHAFALPANKIAQITATWGEDGHMRTFKVEPGVVPPGSGLESATPEEAQILFKAIMGDVYLTSPVWDISPSATGTSGVSWSLGFIGKGVFPFDATVAQNAGDAASLEVSQYCRQQAPTPYSVYVRATVTWASNGLPASYTYELVSPNPGYAPLPFGCIWETLSRAKIRPFVEGTQQPTAHNFVISFGPSFPVSA